MSPVIQRRRRSRGRSIKRRVNRFQDAIRILANFIVPESKHPVSLLRQPTRSGIIVGFISTLSMLSAVDFDQQPRRHTAKVGNVRTDWHLSAKIRTVDFKFSQGIGCMATKASGS